MPFSRRAFVSTALFGAAGLYTGRAAGAESPSIGARQAPLANEDGYKLWLRYTPVPGAASRLPLTHILIEGTSSTATAIRREMSTALSSILGTKVADGASGLRDGAFVVGTPDNSSAIRGLAWDAELKKAGAEGYVIRPAKVANRSVIAVASTGEIGALYGAFHLLRLVQTDASLERLDVV